MDEQYPSILDRIKSTTIDTIIVIACMLLFTDILAGFESVPNWVKMILFLSLLMYEPLCITFGATLGNHKMNIRVRKAGDETKRINLFQALIRFILKYLFGWLSFITVFVSPKSRTIHDLFSGSVIIKIKE